MKRSISMLLCLVIILTNCFPLCTVVALGNAQEDTLEVANTDIQIDEAEQNSISDLISDKTDLIDPSYNIEDETIVATGEITEADTENHLIILKTLSFMCNDPDSGIKDIIDVNNLMIGGKITVFDYNEDGAVESETEAYPLFNDKALCAVAFVSYGVAQIDYQIIEEMACIAPESNNISLLYDAFTNSDDNNPWMLTNSAYPNYWA